MKKFLIILLIIVLMVFGVLIYAKENPREPVVRKTKKRIEKTRENREQYFEN